MSIFRNTVFTYLSKTGVHHSRLEHRQKRAVCHKTQEAAGFHYNQSLQQVISCFTSSSGWGCANQRNQLLQLLLRMKTSVLLDGWHMVEKEWYRGHNCIESSLTANEPSKPPFCRDEAVLAGRKKQHCFCFLLHAALHDLTNMPWC